MSIKKDFLQFFSGYVLYWINRMSTNLPEFSIMGIALDDSKGLPIIILQSVVGKGVFPLSIGPFEASAIIIEIEGVHPPRPMTHDLLAEFFTRHHYHCKNFIIYQKMEDDFLARIEYSKGLRNYSMEVRPSDGIALAIRLGVPIFISPDLLVSKKSSSTLLEETKSISSEILYFDSHNLGVHMM